MDKDYYLKQAAANQYNAACSTGAAISQGAPTPTDPASLRQQYSALCVLCERLSTQRNRLRDIADFVLGGEPEEAPGSIGANKLSPVGGLTAELVSAFESAGQLLLQIDRQIDRLQRVSS